MPTVPPSGPPPSSPPGPWDPGLQPERTTLSWVRTALAYAVVSLLAARLAPGAGAAALAVALTGLLVASLMVLDQGRRLRRRDSGLRTGGISHAPFAVLGATMSVLALAAASLALVIARH